MSNLTATVQSGDWKSEKHVPVIKAPESVKKDESFIVTAVVGEEIAHPNTFEHYIKWIKVFFKPESGKFPVEVASVDFDAHGESGILTDFCANVSIKIQESGELMAMSYCNIHGLWENSVPVKCE
ncbi:class II SORL domain-containing protein [Alkalibacter saccharofermentans]|jgi:superoxide reductase|uniref:Superoxide reductase n=1 Tax=Alkalibacter saccharofermentans DSM 14828 TaxID=1120975 RepID=A0A1M4YBQ5_9FIRM|nr:class II SORL domain-containing protein [Alkalibacter saccharofermentans]SHF03038.1 superoxide reductase [Alkalibacter saccharofermentans DSM 14828]